jgi:DNA-directed RNA polymerase subunit RPC12/RpoP
MTNERQRPAAGESAARQRDDPPPEGVLVQVCIQCGKEYMFEEDEPPAELRCEKCGSVVFRSFFSDTSPDEARRDFEDTTGRELAPNDPAADVTRSDLHDLNNP